MFESSRPTRRRDSGGRITKFVKRDGSGAGVFHLVLTCEWANDLESAHAEAASKRIQTKIRDRPVARQRVRPFGVRTQNGFCFERLLRKDCRYSWLQDPGFFGGDLREFVTEERFVVEIDGCDDAQGWHHHICRIQAPAHSHFEHHNVGPFSREQQKRHGGHCFEVGRMQIQIACGQHSLRCFMYFGEGLRELKFADCTPCDLDTLSRFNQVRRSIEAGADARCAQTRFDHRAGGAFSVRSGHVYETAVTLWIAESLHELRDAIQPKLCGLDFVTQRVKKADRLGVVHPAAPLLCTNITRPASASSNVPPMIFSSNSQTEAMPGGGVQERITAIPAMSAPAAPARR